MLDLTRAEFALRLDITPRALATYLLPPLSKQRRTLSEALRRHIEHVVRDQRQARTPRVDHAPRRALTPSRVRCSHTGLVFPTLYRVVGYEYDFKALERGVDRRGRAHETMYALADVSAEPAQVGLFSATCTPITHLDAQLDHGWVHIIHHANADQAEGYLRAVYDQLDDEEPASPMLYKTDHAIFTLLQRNARPGTPDHLIVYETEYVKPHPLFGPDFVEGWTRVIGPNGRSLPEAVLHPRAEHRSVPRKVKS